jgi:hypothetical protein
MVFLITTGLVFVFFMFLHPTPMWKVIIFGWRTFWMGVLITLGFSSLAGVVMEVVLWLI